MPFPLFPPYISPGKSARIKDARASRGMDCAKHNVISRAHFPGFPPGNFTSMFLITEGKRVSSPFPFC